MTAGTRRRGQPLVVLLALLGGWVGLRVVAWETPTARGIDLPSSVAIPLRKPRRRSPFRGNSSLATRQEAAGVGARSPAFAPRASAPATLAGVPLARGWNEPAVFSQSRLADPFAPTPDPVPGTPAAAPYQPQPRAGAPAARARWSVDAWVLLRRDTTTAVTSGRGSYGQSQAGAVLRYQLAPESGWRPSIYLRGSKALAGAREAEAALGFAVRPLPKLPISIAAELRAARVAGRIGTRAAAYAVTELPPIALPLGFTGETYAQAGYVWGDFETGFVDGQVRADHPLVRLRGTELRAGGGVWGGAQKGASRLDVGPGATLLLKIAQAPARVSLDWRFRVAGQAQPANGPALTISAGF